jgi:ABC-2 type transport system ATP-binding protein
MTPLVQATHLSKWYGQVSGLNDITVTIPPGITGLLGPNGAGKSTFMKLITGQLQPSQGALAVMGEPVWGNPGMYRRMGFCPEQDAFYERMTGLEWVTALVRLNGYTDEEARQAARDALAVVDLLPVADRKIGAYSKGMRQRVKLAQALAHQPELVVLDEPLTGMDPLMRRSTIRAIRQWAKQGRHVIVSSHILHEVEAMTSNILLINNGRIVADGDVHQIRDLLDTHPHTVSIQTAEPRLLAQHLLREEGVLSLRLSEQHLVVETQRPDAFYARVTALAASGDAGSIAAIESTDDNLQAVFRYLVKA